MKIIKMSLKDIKEQSNNYSFGHILNPEFI